MTFIDRTAVKVVLPLLGDRLQASGPQLQWIVEAYMLLLTSLMSINNAISRLASLPAVTLVGVLSSGAFAAALGRTAVVAAGLAAVGAASAAMFVRPGEGTRLSRPAPRAKQDRASRPGR
jgi:hypothetical protein